MFPLLHIFTLLWTGKSRWEGVVLSPTHIQNLVSFVSPVLTILKSSDLFYILLGLPSSSCLPHPPTKTKTLQILTRLHTHSH